MAALVRWFRAVLRTGLSAGALGLAGCMMQPAGVRTEPPPIPAAFKELDPRWTTAVPAEASPRGAWWKAFDDPQLDALIERAARDSGSVRSAAARLAQARAIAGQVQARRVPRVDMSAGAGRLGGPLVNAAASEGNLFTLTASVAYEADLFGRLARAGEAADRDVEAREALLQSARLMVQADVAQTYLRLRACDAERALLQRTADAWRETVRLSERRQAAGLGPELDVERARTELAASEAEGLAIERQRAELEHALAVLVDTAVPDFSLPAADSAPALPSVPMAVPGRVVTRRPDIAAARAAVHAAQTRLGIAQTAWFPDLSLTAAAGRASSEFGELLRASARAWGLGALLALPLLDGGRRQAGVDAASADLELAAVGYRDQILVAFREVEDQLAALRLLSAQADAQARAIASAQRARELSESRYRSGLVSQLEFLDARRVELHHRRQAMQVRFARHLATVGLVRALGGDWAPTASVAAIGPTDLY